jgi:purine-binding chemotaxis protein CheW
VLIARVGSLACAIPVEHVVETMRPLPVEPLGRGPAYVLGLAVIRGVPTIVIDLAELLGTRASARARYVLVRTGERVAALLVDAVDGVSPLAAAELAALPPLARSTAGDVIAAVGAVDAGLVLVLEAARLVSEVPA